MKIQLATALLLSSVPALAGETVALLKLSDGTEYKQVEIMGVSAKGLRILHASGAANVPVDQLPAGLQAKYGDAQQKAAAEAEAKAKADASKPAPASMPDKVEAAPAPGAAPAAPSAPAPAALAPAATAPLPQVVTGKIFGIAEVLAEKFKFDGKILRVDIAVNSASKIEQISKEECQIFVGDPYTKQDSDYTYMRFPEAGRKKIETMINGARGRMTLYVQVEATAPVPLKAVGRSTISGAPGTPITLKW